MYPAQTLAIGMSVVTFGLDACGWGQRRGRLADLFGCAGQGADASRGGFSDPPSDAGCRCASSGVEGRVAEAELPDLSEKVPITARLLLRESLTARRAAGIIAGFTVLITVAGGILERLVDHQEFHTIGRGLWFALQTVTTVGYGDVTPKQSNGRFIAAVLMLAGIGFLAVITASVTASLIESSRRRFAVESEVDVMRRLEEISDRLAKIEAAGHSVPPTSPR
jgi:voltage-gated potassium channel